MQSTQQEAKLDSFERIYLVFSLAYLGILPFAQTIALRNVLLVILFGMLGWGLVARRSRLAFPLRDFLSVDFLPFLLWMGFLLLFPSWAVERDTALANLRGQWGLSIVSWLVGAGAVLLLGVRGPGLWALSGASAALVGVHLALSLLAWMGLLGSPVPNDIQPAQLLHTVGDALRAIAAGEWQGAHFPWGFRGMDPMHGNLGYTAVQAVCLLLVCLLLAWQGRRLREMCAAAAVLVLCFASVAIASSRGAMLYAIAIVVAGGGLVVYRAMVSTSSSRPMDGVLHMARKRLLPLLAVLIVLIATWLVAAVQDPRWHMMLGKARMGFMVEDPIATICNGVDEKIRLQIRQRLPEIESGHFDELIRGLDGDGGRILLMRAGLQLVLDSPQGLDGSRQSYKKLIEQRCGHPPALVFAHSHDGWIDTALGLGWLGAILLAALFMQCFRLGWKTLGRPELEPWALAMLLVSLFWLLRGFADSVYREHYLQMQALVLSYLLARWHLERRRIKATTAAARTGGNSEGGRGPSARAISP